MKKITLLVLFLAFSVLGYSQFPTPGIEGFENTTGPAALPATNWNLGTGATGNQWAVFDNGVGLTKRWTINTVAANVHSGTNAAYMDRENIGQANTSKDFLATPLITVPTNGQLRFWTRSTTSAITGTLYQIRVAPSTATQTDPAAYAATLVQQWTESTLTTTYNVYEEKVVDLSAYAGQQVYLAFVMEFTQPTTALDGDRWLIDDVQLITQCLDPTNLSVTATTHNTATLTWATNGSSSWEIEIVPTPGTPTGSGTVYNGTLPYIATGLNPNTTYNFYVRALCGSINSPWVGPTSFTTTLAPLGCGGNFVDSGGAAGNYQNGENITTIICPDNATDLVTVTFTAFTLENNWDFLRVYAGNSTAAPQIGNYTGATIPPSISSAGPGQCLTFVFTSDGSVSAAGWVANVTCAPAPTCSKPTTVTTSAVLSTSTTLSWTQPANPDTTTATAWEALALPCGSPLPTATTTGWVAAPTNPFTMTGLNPDTCYTFYVRAVCSASDSSTWSDGVNATTQQIPPACGGTFSDPGGVAGQYANNITAANGTTTICPTNSTDLVTVTFTSFATENCCDHLSIYAGDSSASPLIGTYQGTAIPPSATSTAPGQCLTFVFTSDGSVVGDGWVANVTCAPAPTCSKPTAVTTSAVLSTSTTLSWTQPANPDTTVATAWEVLALPCGSPLPTATTTGWVAAPTNPFTMTGLTPDTCYTFYVRAVCSASDSSAWSNGVNATTQPVPPACGGTFTDPGGASGQYANNANVTTTICPTNAGDLVTVIFTSFNLENNFDNLRVYDGDNTANLIGTYTGTALPPIITSTAANGCLTFVFTSDGSVIRDGWIANIICSPPPACQQPTALTVSDITENSATLSWTELNAGVNSWQVVVQPAGTGYPNASSTIINVTTNPYTVTPLNPNTPYEYYVLSDCGATDGLSFWSGPRPFSTLFPGCGGSDPAGNICAEATPVCSLNGYCGNTSSTYTSDSWTQLSTEFCGSIENNSFLTFQANSTSITMDVNVGNCSNNSGIQFMIFSAATCGSGPVTDLGCYFQMDPGVNTLTFTGLTAGQIYYLMIDGFAGDVCDYSVNVTSGGSTTTNVAVSPTSQTICLGTSVNLTATGGNGTYNWSPASGLNTTTGSTVTFTPTTTGTFQITVESTDPNPLCSTTAMATITVVDEITPTFTAIPSICQNTTAPALATTSTNAITGTWSPSTINTATPGTTTYTFTPNAGQCAIVTTMDVTITPPGITPTFTAIPSICQNDTAPALATTSTNAITGTWSPPTIDTATLGTTTYTFTPNAGQCAIVTTMDVTITPPGITPTFAAIPSICQNDTAPALPTTSTNSIIGVWNPSTIDTSTPGTTTYSFTPNAGQCATVTTMDVTITPGVTPQFLTPAPICSGSPAPTLPTTSDNSITGTWSPSTVSNTASGTYTFTPNAGQCASVVTMNITVLSNCSFGSHANAVWLENCANTTTNGDFYNTTGSGADIIGPAANVFPNTYYGTYLQNSGTFLFKGGEVKTFKSAMANVCSARLHYRVYQQATAPGTFTTINLPFFENCNAGTFPSGGPCNPGDQKWQNVLSDALAVDLTAYAPGNYVIEVYYDVTGDVNSTVDCDDNILINNNGANYIATYSIQATPTFTFTNPTTCNGTDGTITISGLTPNINYSVSYQDNGAPVAATTMTSTTNGEIIITGLNAGTYDNFVITANSCNFTGGTVTLVDPLTTMVLSSANDAQTVCINTAISDIVYTTTNGATDVTATGLPAGVTGSYNAGTFTISGTPTASGTFNYTVTTVGGCGTVTLNGTITVNPLTTMVLSSANDAQTVCINTAISDIVYTTSGATDVTLTGLLPAGVTGSYNAGTFTISGTPTASGTFNYTVTTVGGCGTVTLNGTITVNPLTTMVLSSANDAQTVCINTAISNIVYTATNGATDVTVTGLPAGVTGSYNAGTFTISGTPTASGTFNYTVTTVGGCGTVTLNGTITVNPLTTMVLSSANDAQTVCINTAISNIVYATNGATNVTVTGLPAGVTGSYNAGTFTISGTPTASGTFNYTVTTVGGCGTVTLNGTITVNPLTTMVLSSANDAQTVCINTAISNIVYTTTNGATNVTVTGLPAGVTGSYNAGTFTISGTPTASGTFNYTVTTVGGCGTVTLSGTISVTPLTTATFNPISICYNDAAPALPTTSLQGYTGTWSPSVISNTASGTYTFTPSAGQCAAPGTLSVTVYNDFDYTIVEDCANNVFTLEVIASNSTFNEGTASYNWQYNGNLNIGANDAMFNVTNYVNSTSVTETFPMTISVTVTTTDGCSKTHSYTINDITCDIQRGISPNADGLNDFFDLRNMNVSELEIYNRYGVKVYSKGNYTNEWIGQADNGNELPDGTYYYVISFTNNQEAKTGWIYINRQN
jgi:gliding motility-associated-like protein